MVAAPSGDRKPFRMTAATNGGAPAKQPIFHAPPPSACVQTKTVISSKTGTIPKGPRVANIHMAPRHVMSTKTSKAAPNSLSCFNTLATTPSMPSSAIPAV
eukprot:CAMPEP_0179063278 /NCGR_PEP_ID=MMETSP0796-20121207/27353_1 /TAXON_ID=73915 /ORGANISM="Pyrodinium bahamense, Strain pbaha01" /LENGTH=100 /DNA_ID=CAMNT_0020760195 /DNA_START=260 /DNA_END=562 /DNA_ORIENTATION=+